VTLGCHTCSGQTMVVEVNQTTHGDSMDDRVCVCKESKNGSLNYLDHTRAAGG
jgi:hypothetical protein